MQEGEEPDLFGRIIAEHAGKLTGRGRGTLLLDAAHRHAEVLALDHDDDAARLEDAHERVGHLGGEPLLSLAPTPPSAATSVTPSLLATRATPPAPPQLTLHIGRLALHGYSRNEASLLVQGLERGLQQLLAQQRAWPAIAQQLPQLRLPACDWRAAERPEQRGQPFGG